jgi:hypothetical protein
MDPGMMPDMSEMMGSFGQPLVRADLDEWADRNGRPSPTMFDALRFTSLQMRISDARERAQEEHVAMGRPGGKDFPSLGSMAGFFKKGPDGRRGAGWPPEVLEGFAHILLRAAASSGPAAGTRANAQSAPAAGKGPARVAQSAPAAGSGPSTNAQSKPAAGASSATKAQSAPAAGAGPATKAQSAPAAGAGPTTGVVTPPLSSVERKCHACARPAYNECGRCRGVS